MEEQKVVESRRGNGDGKGIASTLDLAPPRKRIRGKTSLSTLLGKCTGESLRPPSLNSSVHQNYTPGATESDGISEVQGAKRPHDDIYITVTESTASLAVGSMDVVSNKKRCFENDVNSRDQQDAIHIPDDPLIASEDIESDRLSNGISVAPGLVFASTCLAVALSSEQEARESSSQSTGPFSQAGTSLEISEGIPDAPTALAAASARQASQGEDRSQSISGAAATPASDEIMIDSTEPISSSDVCEPCWTAGVAGAPLALDLSAQAHDCPAAPCGEMLGGLAAQCSAELHVCLEDPQRGCSSCRKTCHSTCDSLLCSFTPCEYCLSHGVVTHASSHRCIQVQISSGCHTCRRLGCWSTASCCCTRHRHVCAEDERFGCPACNKVCHQSTADPLCPFWGRKRGDLNWAVSGQDSQDARMFQQELHGRLRHRTEFHWDRVGRDGSNNRVVRIDGSYFSLGQASGESCNCFIHSLRQSLNVDVNVSAIRQALMLEFPTTCGALCSALGENCSRTCLKVYSNSYLCTDHWQSVVRLLGVHSVSGPVVLDPSRFCIRVIDLTWSDNGVVLGDPAASQLLTLAREHGNHFIPAFCLGADAHHSEWSPW